MRAELHQGVQVKITGGINKNEKGEIQSRTAAKAAVLLENWKIAHPSINQLEIITLKSSEKTKKSSKKHE